MNAREVVEHISKNDERINIFRSLSERPDTPSNLAGREHIERTPIYTALEPFERWGAVVSLDGRRKLTAAGDIAVRETTDACDKVGREQISYLSSSKNNNRIKLLQALEQPVRKAELVRRSDFPSRSTIDRTFGDFESLGWSTRVPRYELTEQGRSVLNIYSELDRVVRIIVEKAAYLRHVDPLKVDIPIDLIADGDVVQSRSNRPQRVNEVIRERIRDGFSHCRLFSTFYSQEGVNAMIEAMEDGSTWEAVTPFPAHFPLPSSRAELKHMRQGITDDRIEWQIYPEELPLDFVIFDQEMVVLGSNPDLENTRANAILRSENKDLIAWATALYESYKKGASPPLEYLLKPLREQGLYDVLGLERKA